MAHDLLHILTTIGMVIAGIWLFILTLASSKQIAEIGALQKKIEKIKKEQK